MGSTAVTSKKKIIQRPIKLQVETGTPRAVEAWSPPTSPRNPNRRHVEHHFELVKILGDGASGKVHLAKDRTSSQYRAIKEMPRASRANDARIEEEIKILRKLDHPNVVKMYSHFKSPSSCHIVMDYCEGGELFDRIVKAGKLTERLAAQYIADLVLALCYIHKKGIIHRDIKPENLLLASRAEDARIVLADFGGAARVHKRQKLKDIVGTAYYIAPEVLGGRYDEQCDVWSAGVMLYLLLSGTPPFNGSDDAAIYRQIRDTEVKFGQPVWNTVSADARELVTAMLNKNPKERPTAAQVLKSAWLCKHQAGVLPDEQLANCSLQNLAAFTVQSKLLKASLAYIVSQLMEKEEEQELAKLFKSIDKNNDGRLSKAELDRVYQKRGGSVNVQQLLESVDVDGNGYIEYNEFLVASVNWRKAMNRERLYLAFQHFDQNGDGSISLEEMQKALGSSDEGVFAKLMTEIDRDGDGTIDFSEFSRYIVKHLKRGFKLPRD